jgi:hypothetical protein
MHWCSIRFFSLAISVIALTAGHAQADDIDDEFSDDEFSDDEFSTDESSKERARRKTASAAYATPSLVFVAHGYATVGFALPSDDFGSEAGATPQILVSGISPRVGRNRGGFRSDGALFIGGETGRVSTNLELHFVGTGLDPVMTEAKLSYDFFDDDEDLGLRIIGGRYWWPFGAHDQEWFSNVNAFSLVSVAATEVVPAHYNEVGVALEGEYGSPSSDIGLNWILSVGNGVPGFDLGGNVRETAFDYNGNRTLTGRAGIVYSGSVELDAGMSLSSGRLRAGTDMAFELDDARRHAATFLAFGPDLELQWKDLALRTYLYVSDESFDDPSGSANLDVLERVGATIEPSYTHQVGNERLQALRLVLRASQASEDRLDGLRDTRTQVGAALHAVIDENFVLKLSYVAQWEDDDARGLDNNVAGGCLTASF